MNIEQIGNSVGVFIAALIAGWVGVDASKRGFKTLHAIGWSLGVFLLLIVFLPLYLWARRHRTPNSTAVATANAPIAGVPCRYCGYENAENPDFCGKCGRQLRSSTEIHR